MRKRDLLNQIVGIVTDYLNYLTGHFIKDKILKFAIIGMITAAGQFITTSEHAIIPTAHRRTHIRHIDKQ